MPVASAVVRLSDVAPDGTIAQVTAGIRNLTHRLSDLAAQPLVPGEVVEYTIPLRATGYRFEPGHRIRLSVASAYWPVIWPSPYAGELTIHLGPSYLLLCTAPAEASASGAGLPDRARRPARGWRAEPRTSAAAWQIQRRMSWPAP